MFTHPKQTQAQSTQVRLSNLHPNIPDDNGFPRRVCLALLACFLLRSPKKREKITAVLQAIVTLSLHLFCPGLYELKANTSTKARLHFKRWKCVTYVLAKWIERRESSAKSATRKINKEENVLSWMRDISLCLNVPVLASPLNEILAS